MKKWFIINLGLKKKLSHIIRGHEFAKMILNKDFNPVFNDELKNICNEFVEHYLHNDMNNYIDEIIKPFREELNYLKDHKNLPEQVNVHDQILLDRGLLNLIKSNIYKDKMNWGMDLTLFYQVNENPEIKYDTK